MNQSETPTLECVDLEVTFGSTSSKRSGAVHAVKGVSLRAERDRVLGIVGESGSGKSTLARALIGLQRPTLGQVRCVGEDPAHHSASVRKRIGRHVSMIFQDPRSSLNPRLSVAAVISDPLVVHGLGKRSDRREVVLRSLDDVGLSPAVAERPVRTLSGGQLQRVAIARALVLEPDFIVADEPTSALDVSIQAQILNLLAELRSQRHFGMLVISHDMRVIRFLCDDIVVMLEGEIVERGAVGTIFSNPTHPYTRKLISATPLLVQDPLSDLSSNSPAQ
jgi:peptide/nickel transport system ATP-binding protein